MPAMRLTPQNLQDAKNVAVAEASSGGALIAVGGVLLPTPAAPATPFFLAAGAGLEVAAAGTYIAIAIVEATEQIFPIATSGHLPIEDATIPEVVEVGAHPDDAAPAPILVDDPPISFEFPEGPGEGTGEEIPDAPPP